MGEAGRGLGVKGLASDLGFTIHWQWALHKFGYHHESALTLKG